MLPYQVLARISHETSQLSVGASVSIVFFKHNLKSITSPFQL